MKKNQIKKYYVKYPGFQPRYLEISYVDLRSAQVDGDPHARQDIVGRYFTALKHTVPEHLYWNLLEIDDKKVR